MKYFGSEFGIAPWKIDSPIERFLSHRADNSELWKKIYVMFYRIFDSDYYKGGLTMIDKILADNKFNSELWGGKRKIVRDMIYSLHRFGCEFNEYFIYEFYRLNTEARDSFICSKNRWKYYLYFNKTRNNPIFDDKNQTYLKFADYIHRKYCCVMSVVDKQKFELFESEVSSYLIKPMGGSGGRGVIIAKRGEYSIDELTKTYPDGLLAEEIIHNHDVLTKVNESSLNTIRVATVKSDNKVDIVFAFIRFGREGSVVDNGFRGGIMCNIDIETGIITSTSTEKGQKYIVHPDSKQTIIGLKVPNWERVKQMAKQLASVVPDCRLVGWDIAVTNDDVLMIEANCKSEFIGPQMSTARGIKSTIESLMN